MKLSLIVPMYNEASIIEDSARTFSDYLSAKYDSYELLFVDDGSRDDCAARVEALQLPNTRVIRYTPNQGKGNAVRTGVLAAQGEIRMFLDADVAYGTEVIERAVAMFAEHPDRDLVIGSRPLHPEGYAGYTFLRKLASETYIKVLSLVGGFRLSDSQCGCKAYRGKAAEEIFSRTETKGFAFDFETILWAQKLGYGIVEMPVKIINHRESKVNVLRDTFRMLSELRAIKKRVKTGK
ncbi:MAG: glycosyltransferase family 2 protein [Oscillospiraceae bacterium]|nr:glycosyltransferase family 2 protein [Oscillospiraceae bacterium]